MDKLAPFDYRYLAHPVYSAAEFQQTPLQGNCRFGVQYYYLHQIHNKFLERDDILLPQGFTHVGITTFEAGQSMYAPIEEGSIIYAQQIKGYDGHPIDRSMGHFGDYTKWVLALHSAIFIGQPTAALRSKLPPLEEHDPREPLIWHSSAFVGKAAVWTVRKFNEHYKIVRVKRVL